MNMEIEKHTLTLAECLADIAGYLASVRLDRKKDIDGELYILQTMDWGLGAKEFSEKAHALLKTHDELFSGNFKANSTSAEEDEKNIKNVIEALSNNFDRELFTSTHEGLERYWHFRWQDESSIEINLYDFHKMLDLYGGFCRHWEEHHNGYTCVVERVRDTYLMPKIREFVKRLHMANSLVHPRPAQPCIEGIL
jgi:hypothetical protein